jgi:hypothetical protein
LEFLATADSAGWIRKLILANACAREQITSGNTVLDSESVQDAQARSSALETPLRHGDFRPSFVVRFWDSLSLAIVITPRDRSYFHLRKSDSRRLSIPHQEMKMPMSLRSTRTEASSQPRSLLIAATVAVLASTFGFVPPSSADSAPAGTVEVAQARPADMAQCQELYRVWQRYKGVSTNGSGRDIQSQAALQDCRNGHAAAGIAQLEQLLKNDRIPIPEVSSAAR